MICSFCTANTSLSNRQLKWWLLKYEVRKFTINCTKQIAKEKRQQRTNLEKQLKILEQNLDEDDKLSKNNNIENELHEIDDHTTEVYVLKVNATGMNTAKINKIFLNLEKQRRAQIQ